MIINSLVMATSAEMILGSGAEWYRLSNTPRRKPSWAMVTHLHPPKHPKSHPPSRGSSSGASRQWSDREIWETIQRRERTTGDEINTDRWKHPELTGQLWRTLGRSERVSTVAHHRNRLFGHQFQHIDDGDVAEPLGNAQGWGAILTQIINTNDRFESTVKPQPCKISRREH